MKIHPFHGLIALCLMLASSSHARADVVNDWNEAALTAIRTNRTSPPQASRALALLHASIYDAVNGIVRSHEPYIVRGQVPASASAEAAASAAAHRVLVTLFPGDVESFDALHAALLGGIQDGPHKQIGTAWGESVADQILAWRSQDNSDAVVAPPTADGVGDWVPTPPLFVGYLLPQWGFVSPFVIPTGAHFRPLGPPAPDSVRYADEYNEMKALGAAVASTRTPEQDEIALFWADGAGTETPPGHWNSIARVVSAEHPSTLAENARLFALLNLALADAAIAAWDAKYHFHSWRPVTAIRNGDLDGNPATTGRGELVFVYRDATVSGLRLRPQHFQRRGIHGARPFLRRQQRAVHHVIRFAPWTDSIVRQLLRGCPRGRGEPAIRRHPLPIGK